MSEEIYGEVNTRNPNFGDVAVDIAKTRIIYRCTSKKCKHTWAHEYRKVYSKMEEKITPRNGFPFRIPAKFDFLRYAKGLRRSWDEDRTCPKCGRGFGTSNIVVGVLNPEHKCDARCTTAKNGDCECGCGGRNHGIAHLVA